MNELMASKYDNVRNSFEFLIMQFSNFPLNKIMFTCVVTKVTPKIDISY